MRIVGLAVLFYFAYRYLQAKQEIADPFSALTAAQQQRLLRRDRVREQLVW